MCVCGGQEFGMVLIDCVQTYTHTCVCGGQEFGMVLIDCVQTYTHTCVSVEAKSLVCH